MATQQANQAILKKCRLKKLAKQRKRVGTGDGGLLTNKTRGTLK